MGRFINVDLRKLKKGKNALVEYSISRINYVNELKITVDHTTKNWDADDSKMFLLRWDSLSASDGVFTMTEEFLDSYTSLLNSAYKAYKKAQSDSVEQASKIGGW